TIFRHRSAPPFVERILDVTTEPWQRHALACQGNAPRRTRALEGYRTLPIALLPASAEANARRSKPRAELPSRSTSLRIYSSATTCMCASLLVSGRKSGGCFALGSRSKGGRLNRRRRPAKLINRNAERRFWRDWIGLGPRRAICQLGHRLRWRCPGDCYLGHAPKSAAQFCVYVGYRSIAIS